jgi:hypothetical protein
MKKAILLIFVPVVLASCSSMSNTKVLEVGKTVSNSDLSPMVRTACSAEKEQKGKNVTIEVNLGHYGGFSKDWNQNLFGTNLGYGDFSLIRSIKDTQEKLVSTSYFTIGDFPSDKYDFRLQSSDDPNKEFVVFNYCYQDIFEIPDNLSAGSVAYSIGIIYDNEVIIDNLKCGTFLSSLYFKNVNGEYSFYVYEYEMNV